VPSPPPPKRHPYDQWSPDARALDLVGDKWTLLIIRDLASGPRRFVELQRTLPGISTEQLRSRLNRMVADGLLTRQRYREVPPRVDYELTERSRALMPVLGELARWGYDWTWGQPREQEEINIGAILRLAPGLLEPAKSVRGTIECHVLASGNEPERVYSLTAADGAVTLTEQASGMGEATVTGAPSAWVRAFGPGGSLDELQVEGRSELAEGILGGFLAAAAQARGESAAA
jgi:DNA-binding HxlR family transcriptional regulator